MKTFIILISSTLIPLLSMSQHGINIERFDGKLLSYGINLSKTSTKLYQIGGDFSVLEFQYKEMIWYGGYMDFMYNKNYNNLSIGPKFGFWFAGCDLAYYNSFQHNNTDKNEHGIQARIQLSVMLIHPYIRFSKSLNSANKNFEFGVLIKMLEKLK